MTPGMQAPATFPRGVFPRSSDAPTREAGSRPRTPRSTAAVGSPCRDGRVVVQAVDGAGRLREHRQQVELRWPAIQRRGVRSTLPEAHAEPEDPGARHDEEGRPSAMYAMSRRRVRREEHGDLRCVPNGCARTRRRSLSSSHGDLALRHGSRPAVRELDARRPLRRQAPTGGDAGER